MTNIRGYIISLRWIEIFFAIAILVGLVKVIWYVATEGYLPQPYFYDANDAWMDWYNTADWARNIGTYDSWGSVYPPLSFVILKIFGLNYCYEGGAWFDNSYYARSCDWVGAVAVHFIYVLDVILVALIYLKTDKSTALVRSFSIAAGLPLTAALERGNLLILAFMFMILAHGPLLKSARWRWFSLGMAMNLKLYMISTLFAQLLRRRWRWFEGGLIAGVAIYLLCYGLLERGTPMEVINNIVAFQTEQGPSQFLDLFNQATYAPMLLLFNNFSGPISNYIGSTNVDLALIALPIVLRVVQAITLLAAVAAWLRPEVIPMYRINNLAICFALITVESGNYTHLLPVFFTFFEKWRGIGPKVAIICSYVLLLQFDIPLDRTIPLLHDTFYNHGTGFVVFYVLLGPFVKPLIFYMIPFALACTTLHTVWRDVRGKGWQTRLRYRNDVPILT